MHPKKNRPGVGAPGTARNALAIEQRRDSPASRRKRKAPPSVAGPPKTFSAPDLARLPPALKPFTKHKRWVVWRWTRNGTKWDKPPYQSKNPRAKAASNNPATWSSHAAAVKAVKDGKADGIGYVLTKGKIAAADLDDCRDPDSGKLTPWAQEMVAEAQAIGAYVETTVSGTGLRTIGVAGNGEKLDTKLRIESGGSVELYRNAVRYITISGLEISDSRKLPNIDALLDRTYARHKPEHKSKSSDGKFTSNYPPASREEIQAALDATPSDDYKIWYENGCALYNKLGEGGFELFEQWSKKSEKYNARQCAKQWKACKKRIDEGGDYGDGTIFLYANEAAPGWRAAAAEKVKSGNLIQSSGEFVKDFTPPDYLMDGLLQRHFIYSLTGPTGAGKTAIVLRLAMHVALGLSLDDKEIEKARVLFFAGENPDDVRMRYIKLCEEMAQDPATVDVFFLPGTPPISNEQIRKRIDEETTKHGPFGLLIVDTSAAYFRGEDENSNVQVGAHARMLRSFVSLSGGPTILVTAHPLKTPNMDNLLPRGGGAFLAEVDGNLVAIKQDPIVQLHWHGKFRGPDFAPIPFKLTPGTTEKLKDKKGRLIWTVTAEPISETEKSVMEEGGRARQNELLLLLQAQPGLSLSKMAEALDWKLANGKPNKSMVSRVLTSLQADKLVVKARGHANLTKLGEAEAEKAKVVPTGGTIGKKQKTK
jgi:hypothetical protein